MSTSAATPLPTIWLTPPPNLLSSSHTPPLEPASLTISAILTLLTLTLLTTLLLKKHSANFLDDTSSTPHSDKRLTISGPLDDVLARNNAPEQPIPRLWSGFSSSNEEIRGMETGEMAATEARRRAFELVSMSARGPEASHSAAPLFSPYQVELDVVPRLPREIHRRSNFDVRQLPLVPRDQRDIHNDTYTDANANDGSNINIENENNRASRPQPPPTPTTRRNPQSDFGDDTTVVRDKADVETLRSDLSFLDTDSDSASYEEGRWRAMQSKDVGLVGRHWE